jgi:hypothetical protein
VQVRTKREKLRILVETRNALQAAQLFVSGIIENHAIDLASINEKKVLVICDRVILDLRKAIENIDAKHDKMIRS